MKVMSKPVLTYNLGQNQMGHLAIYGREKAVSSRFPLFNVAVMLSRTLTYMLTYNIDLGDGGGGGRGKVALPN